MSFIDVDLSKAPHTIAPPEGHKEMLTVRRDGGQTLVKINSSSLSLMQTCPTKAMYTLHRQLRARAGSPALEFGSAIHAALEVFYSGAREARVLPTNMKENLDIMGAGGSVPNEEEFLVLRATREFIARAEPLAPLPPTDKRSIANGVWILGEYFKNYIDDPYVVYEDAEGPFVERRLESVLLDSAKLKIIVHGTIDLVLKNMANGQVLVTDHKTTSQVGQDFFNRLKPNHQYTGYLYLVHRETDIDTDTFLVNGIEVKAKPKTSRGKGPHFPRQPTKRTMEDFDAYERMIEYYTRQYLAWDESGHWPMGHVDNCAMWGGCNYHQVCSAPNALRENIIEAKYDEPGRGM